MVQKQRSYGRWILLNVIGLMLFYAVRCLVMNVNVFYSLLILLQGAGLLAAAFTRIKSFTGIVENWYVYQ